MKIKLSKNIMVRIWQVTVIILLNVALITAFVLPNTAVFSSENSTYALSKLGSRGDEVKQVQKALKNEGLYNGSVDGVYGNATRSAVIKFQKRCGLSADGVAGKKTLLYLGITGSSTSQGSSSGSSQHSQSDITLLARVISGEARGEPYEGQVAVGAVILNRIQHPSFPDSIAGVVYQKGAFSCINDSNWSKPTSPSAVKAAKDAINGWDPSGGAIYYYNAAKTSNAFMHARPVIKVIGGHRFCK